MKLFPFQKFLQVVTNLQFAICLLGILAFFSSVGSIIEQDESVSFYQENYPLSKPLYGFFTWKWILFFGLNQLYTTTWFFGLLALLSISLVSCTFTRQFPLLAKSKKYTFYKEKQSFFSLPFFVEFPNLYYTPETFLGQLQKKHFFLYQKEKVIYGASGLVGRISPILVHVSLLLILGGSFISAFYHFKAQELLPKGELFHIQNPIGIGNLTSLPSFSVRVNDFWVEYRPEEKNKENRVQQFYSNLSILNEGGKEIKQQTISVNNPLKYQGIDIYQSDWNLVAIRLESLAHGNKEIDRTGTGIGTGVGAARVAVGKNSLPSVEGTEEREKNLEKEKGFQIELPLFSLQKKGKSWITWFSPELIATSRSEKKEKKDKIDFKTLVVDQFENTVGVYNEKGQFETRKTLGDSLLPNVKVSDILPSTGLLLKYDPTIPVIYLGFGLLMITTSLSYIPFTQFWMVTKSTSSWVGCSTNRGKIELEILFENVLRAVEKDRRKNSLPMTKEEPIEMP